MLVKLSHPDAMPFRAHETDAGLDLKSMTSHILGPGESYLFDTGIAFQIPTWYVGLVFNRSGQGKTKVQLNNGVGVIDSSYRGNIKVLLTNNGKEPYTVNALDTRIAQLVIVPISIPTLVEYTGLEEDWNNTKRGEGGFGSTG